MLRIERMHASDERELVAFLRQHRESSLFLLSNLNDAPIGCSQSRFSGYYYAARREGVIVGAMAFFPYYGNLIVQAPEGCREIAVHIISYVRQYEICGLIGPSSQVGAIESLFPITKEQLTMDEEEGLYHLRLDSIRTPPILSNGVVEGRKACQDDISILVKWRIAYAIETLHCEPGPEVEASSFEDIRHNLAASRLYVLQDRPEGQERQKEQKEEQTRQEVQEVDNKSLVSMSGINARTYDCVQIGGVYTPHEMRCKGYARAVVAHSLLDLRESGVVDAVLFTGNENRAAIATYEAIGFRKIGDYRLRLWRKDAKDNK